MSLIKKSFVVLLSILVIFSGFGVGGSVLAEESSTKTITILHTNDTHAKVEPSNGGMGFAKLATLIKDLKEENPNTLLLDAGDTFHGTPFATLEKGESIARIFNQLGYDALAAGNHDFNYGTERLIEITELLDFPVISANVRYKDTSDLLLDPYTIKTVDGIKIGIFGLTTPETHYKTNPKNVEKLEFTDPVEEAKEMVELLQGEGVDVIVALTHLGIDASSTETSILVAEEAPGIDLIVDGHSHSKLVAGQEEGENTLIVSAGEHTKNLGIVELTFEDNTLVDKQARLITQEDASDVEEDAETRALIDSITENHNELLQEKVGFTNEHLEGARDFVRTGQTNLGSLLTDAMVAATGADVALTNGGGIRASIPVGIITKGDVVNVLPFGNYVVTKKVTGADIKAALEHGTKSYPESSGSFPHVSGMTFEIDESASEGDRIKNLTIGEEAVNLEQEYVLATNDFLAVGGDGYTMLADGDLLNEYAALDEILISYIQEHEDFRIKPLPFKDVPNDRWSYDFIEDLYNRNMIKGTSETKFSPKNPLTRVQFASLLVRAFDLGATEIAPFTDISKLPADIELEISAAYENGIIRGVTETTFVPNQPITRAQMAIMLERSFELFTEEEYEAEEELPFKDTSSLDSESLEAIQMAYELGLVNGYDDNTFKPKNSATREESAKVLSLFLSLFQ